MTRCVYNIGRPSFRCLCVLRCYTIHSHHHIRRYNFFSFSYAPLYWIRFRMYGCWCSQFCSAGFLRRILLVLLVCWRVDCWCTTDWLTEWLVNKKYYRLGLWKQEARYAYCNLFLKLNTHTATDISRSTPSSFENSADWLSHAWRCSVAYVLLYSDTSARLTTNTACARLWSEVAPLFFRHTISTTAVTFLAQNKF